MYGRVLVEHHKIQCIIGNDPEEWEKVQDIYVDIQVEADFAPCAESDRVKDTINYVHLANLCTELATTRRYRLLETFAVEAIDRFFKEFNIRWAWIKIKKPGAISTASYAAVELERFKEQD